MPRQTQPRWFIVQRESDIIKAMETIDVPLSWLKGSRFYEREMRRINAPTGDEMRDLGYVINERTWPALRWEKGDR